MYTWAKIMYCVLEGIITSLYIGPRMTPHHHAILLRCVNKMVAKSDSGNYVGTLGGPVIIKQRNIH